MVAKWLKLQLTEGVESDKVKLIVYRIGEAYIITGPPTHSIGRPEARLVMMLASVCRHRLSASVTFHGAT